jgi:hypothetical protein
MTLGQVILVASESASGLCSHASEPALGQMPIDVPAAFTSKLKRESLVEIFSAIQLYQFCELCKGIITNIYGSFKMFPK